MAARAAYRLLLSKLSSRLIQSRRQWPGLDLDRALMLLSVKIMAVCFRVSIFICFW